MAMTYAQLQDVKTRIVRELAAQQTQLSSAKGVFAQISSTLSAMQTTYTEWATEVNALAASQPNNDAVKALKAELDKLVAEFQSTKTSADAYQAAVDGV